MRNADTVQRSQSSAAATHLASEELWGIATAFGEQADVEFALSARSRTAGLYLFPYAAAAGLLATRTSSAVLWAPPHAAEGTAAHQKDTWTSVWFLLGPIKIAIVIRPNEHRDTY